MSSLTKALVGHDVEVQTYRPGLEFRDGGKDLVILSGGGGEGLEIHDEHQPGRLWYEDEMDFIHNTDKNILGICMGFEVIARAYGAPITPIGLILDQEELQLTKEGAGLFGTNKIRQHEAHSWRVQDVPSDFKVRATSRTGIEMFEHKDWETGKTIVATQFHPEKGGTLKLSQLLSV